MDLARNPATATHVATKLARHFVADEPPPALIERLAGTFRDSDGDLKEVAKALIAAPEAWSPTQAKLKRPMEWVVAMVRASGLRGNPERFARGQAFLGQPIWRPSSPKGFADDEGAWIDTMSFKAATEAFLAEHLGGRCQPIGNDFAGSSLEIRAEVAHAVACRTDSCRSASTRSYSTGA